jgi:predicted Rossmann fold flavoprotein
MHKNLEYDIIIIGAGPAGMFTALNAADNLKVALFEKNSSAGKKLLMAGAGRCNITHTGDIEDFFNHYGDNPNFLKAALNEFTNLDLIEFLKCGDIDIIVDKNDKVFPESERSKDILTYLLDECYNNKVNMHYDEPVISVQKRDEVFHVNTEIAEYKCRFLVITTGGLSYPTSGSTGDGYEFAKSFGHTIIDIKPALTPVTIKDYKFGAISGVSLTNKEIYLYRNNKKIKEHVGDLGFTHTGLSGPGILDFSRYFESWDVLKINLINSNHDDIRNIFIESSKEGGSITIKRFFKKFEIPESLIDEVLLEIPIAGSVKLCKVDKESRNKMVELFCGYPFIIERLGDFNIAMVTSGGVSTKEVFSKTMESRIVKNLFFAGEVLNIDGDTGGYNLQAAFSTGFLAAKSINSCIVPE